MRGSKLGTWIVRLGWVAASVGVLLLSPVADLLPVEMWLAYEQQHSGQAVLMRVVPGWEPPLLALTMLLVGVAAIATGSRIKSR